MAATILRTLFNAAQPETEGLIKGFGSGKHMRGNPEQHVATVVMLTLNGRWAFVEITFNNVGAVDAGLAST